jgi:hypothetical protein
VERRLDSKLDRLESLLNEADRVLEAAPHPPAPGVAAGPAKTRPPRLLPSGRWDPLDAMSQADRQRVVELASLGELPETIAHSVGLLRGRSTSSFGFTAAPRGRKRPDVGRHEG